MICCSKTDSPEAGIQGTTPHMWWNGPVSGVESCRACGKCYWYCLVAADGGMPGFLMYALWAIPSLLEYDNALKALSDRVDPKWISVPRGAMPLVTEWACDSAEVRAAFETLSTLANNSPPAFLMHQCTDADSNEICDVRMSTPSVSEVDSVQDVVSKMGSLPIDRSVIHIGTWPEDWWMEEESKENDELDVNEDE